MREKLAVDGSTRVSLVLSDPGAGALPALQDDVGSTLSNVSRVVYKFTSGPGMSVQVGSETDLEALAAHPAVEALGVTPMLRANLDDSRGLVGAEAAFAAGVNGETRRVAVIDTGIEATHDDLEDDVIAEACMCSSFISGACCPDGTEQQIGPGSAADDNGHGTHVSGIVTSAGTGPAPRGIAPGTGIVAVKVLDEFGFGSADGIVAAMEWVNANHPELDAVNLSLGGGLYEPDCDLEPSPDPFVTNMAAAVAALRGNGILTFAATGNDDSKTLIGAPACISDVVAVGSTDKNLAASDFSNSNEGLDIMAVGDGFIEHTGVTSSWPGNTTETIYGTSMATPHVTAAAALLRQTDSELEPEQVLDCLLTSNTQVTDVNSITRPLLDIPAALEACGFPISVCNEATYEAESIFHSTGGPHPGGWNIWANGYIATNHDFTAGPATITVRASGQSANGVAPRMIVSVGGTTIGTVFVPQTSYTPFTFAFTAPAGVREIRVAFDNDLYQPPQDRNLFVDNIVVDCTTAPANPCAGFCESPQQISWSGSYQSGNLGTGAICRETVQPVVGGNCGNFAGGRQLLVNGVPMPCNNSPWPALPPPSNGGYCIQATPGQFSYAYATLW